MATKDQQTHWNLYRVGYNKEFKHLQRQWNNTAAHKMSGIKCGSQTIQHMFEFESFISTPLLKMSMAHTVKKKKS